MKDFEDLSDEDKQKLAELAAGTRDKIANVNLRKSFLEKYV